MVRKKASRRRAKKTEEGDKYHMWGRRRNGLTDSFILAVYMQFLVAANSHATFRNLSRYSSYHERTFARWYARDFDFVSLNKAAITKVISPEHEQALVI